MSDLTIEILKQIRDGITALRQEVNERLDQTNIRLDQTNSRLDQTNSRLDQNNDRLGRVEQGLLEVGEFMSRHERFHSLGVQRLEEHAGV